MNKLQLTATLYGTETSNLKERHRVGPTVIHTDWSCISTWCWEDVPSFYKTGQESQALNPKGFSLAAASQDAVFYIYTSVPFLLFFFPFNTSLDIWEDVYMGRCLYGRSRGLLKTETQKTKFREGKSYAWSSVAT